MIPAKGLSGGIVAIWRQDIADISFQDAEDQAIYRCINIQNMRAWQFIGVNASTVDNRRQILRQALTLITSLNIPTIVMGDFNEIIDVVDKSGKLYL